MTRSVCQRSDWDIVLLGGDGVALDTVPLFRSEDHEARAAAAELLVSSGTLVFGMRLQRRS